MNKADVVKELEFRLGNRAAAVAALEAVTDLIIREVAKGESVAINGFGVFERVERAARPGRNPKAGTTVEIPAHMAPLFRPSRAFKGYVKDPRTLPRTSSGSLISRADMLALRSAISE